MNPIVFEVTYSDGSKVEAVATAPDFIAFEAKFDKSVQAFQTDMRFTYMFFLAWNALRRTNKTALEFEAWTESVANIGVDAEKKA